MEKVEEDIIKSNILNEGLLSGFRFYLLKVTKTFLNEKFIQQFLKEQPQPTQPDQEYRLQYHAPFGRQFCVS